MAMTREDVTCLALDRAKLAAAVGAILDVEIDPIASSSGPASVVGSHRVGAGISIPVIVWVPGPMITPTEMRPFLSVDSPRIIVVPTGDSIPEHLKTKCVSQGDAVLPLADVTTFTDHRLVGVRPAEQLLAAIREAVRAMDSPSPTDRAWNLPSDARWEEMVMTFDVPGAVKVRFRGETRQFTPSELGMKRQRTGAPTSQWTTLQAFAENDGLMSWSSRHASITVKKQKQLLSQKLILAFGIADDPINWVTGAYQTKFKISGSPLGFRHARGLSG